MSREYIPANVEKFNSFFANLTRYVGERWKNWNIPEERYKELKEN